MSKYQKCPYCGNESDIGVCAFCAPTDTECVVYVIESADGKEVELTPEEWEAIGAPDDAYIVHKTREANYPWERI
jgi:hypothetical protein